MNDFKNNELYQLIVSYIDDQNKVDIIFNCIKTYLIETYGSNGVTIKNLLLIQPSILYKTTINDITSYYKDVVNIIFMYKAQTGIDTGFRIKTYEDVYSTNITYENAIQQKHLVKEQHRVIAEKKKLDKKRKQTPVIKNEDFDKDLLITKQNIINYIQKQYDITFLHKKDLTTFAKDLYNYRYGSLVYDTPFAINNIKDASIYWIGMCDCGNYRITQAGRVHDYKSCSKCMTREHIYIGERYGNLECIDQRYVLSGKHSSKLLLKCKCDCGSIIVVNPAKFYESHNCGGKCKFTIQRNKELGKENTKNIKNIFFNKTNVGKIGRTSSNANSSTGYLGVTFLPNTGKYLAYITFQHKTEQLGTYATPELAYQVRLSAQNMLHMKFLTELDEDEFIQNNKHLVKLLNKVKKSLVESVVDNKKEGK